MPRGGARPNTGVPKGYKQPKTIAKEQAREALRQIILHHAQELVAAQIANAKGIKYLVVREKKSGKFVRVTEAMARQKQDIKDSEEVIEVWEKDPSVQAFTDLLNRAIDKPAEQAQEVEHKGHITFSWATPKS